eukprot:202762-Amphidinium_carterae.1
MKGEAAGLPPLQHVLQSIILDCSPDRLLSRTHGTRALIGGAIPALSMVPFNSMREPLSEGMQETMQRSMLAQLEEGSAFSRSLAQEPDERLFALIRVDTHRVLELQPDVHTLFLYSLADIMIPPEGPERYHAECKQRAGPKTIITKHAFEKVTHCKIKEARPKEYWPLVQGFLDEVMQKPPR